MQAEQSYQKAQLPGGFPAWQPQSVKAMVGVSGVYNCFDLADHFNRRGLYRKLFDNIMSVNGQPNLKLFSPTYCIKASSSRLCHCAICLKAVGKVWGKEGQSLGVRGWLAVYCHDTEENEEL